jgi:hypothetical protein
MGAAEKRLKKEDFQRRKSFLRKAWIQENASSPDRLAMCSNFATKAGDQRLKIRGCGFWILLDRVLPDDIVSLFFERQNIPGTIPYETQILKTFLKNIAIL